MDWKKYQKATSDLFMSLGCSAEVDKLVKGARVAHKIDIWVTFNKFGFQNRWAVECKYWNSNVTKEKVMALKSIVDDLGADRGIIISKTGFQSGAIRAATYMNISLTSLEDLKQTVQDDLIQASLYHLEKRATHIKHELQNLFKVAQSGPNSLVSTPVPGVDWESVIRALLNLSFVEQGFDKIRIVKPPYPVTTNVELNQIIYAPTIESFVESASTLVNDIERLLELQMKNTSKTEKK